MIGNFRIVLMRSNNIKEPVRLTGFSDIVRSLCEQKSGKSTVILLCARKTSKVTGNDFWGGLIFV